MPTTTTTTLDYDAPASEGESEPHTFFDRNPFPAHQFEDAEQQKETATLGMWCFLATEVLLFSGAFLTFFVYRNAYPAAFELGARKLSILWGTINTAVLLGSSLAVALSVRAAQTGQFMRVVQLLGVTIVLGLVFLGIKAHEYLTDYEEGLVPWIGWNHPTTDAAREEMAREPAVRESGGAYPPQLRMFFYLYFVMTGLHAIHMVAGMLILSLIARFARRGKYTPAYYNPVEIAGLYWHFVDIVWVFLFPTLYLLRHIG